MMTNKTNHTDEDPELRMGDHFHARHAHKYVGAYLFSVLFIVVVGAVYTWQHKKVTLEAARVTALQAQLEAAQHSYTEAMANVPKQ